MLGPVELNNTFHTQFARAQAFMPKQMLFVFALLKFILEEFLVWFTRPVEVFLRRKFGVRGHGLFQTNQICFIGTIVGVICVKNAPDLSCFCFASAVLSGFHYREAVRWENRGSPPRYSWSNGEPIPIWGLIADGLRLLKINPDRFLTVSLICRLYEPLLVLGVGLIFRTVSPTLGHYLIGSSVALFIKGVIVNNRLLNLQRDQIDARIMSQYLASIHRSVGGQGEEQYFVVQLAKPPVRDRDDKYDGEEAPSPEQQPPPEQQPRLDTAVMADNLVSFRCRNCKTQFQVHRKHHGRKGTCKRCGNVIVVATEVN